MSPRHVLLIASCAVLLAMALTGCTSLLPRSKETTSGPWQSYKDAQLTFDKVIPGQTTEKELQGLKLHPESNANIAILNYSDVVRRFLPNSSITMADLDTGVRDCIAAKASCRGYEVNQKTLDKRREGDVVADVLGFHRETDTVGWMFNGLILVKGGLVIYTLTSGQPSIVQHEENTSVLGPVQALGQKLFPLTP
jgi:hypothetical protein